jgi:hypothetical protein
MSLSFAIERPHRPQEGLERFAEETGEGDLAQSSIPGDSESPDRADVGFFLSWYPTQPRASLPPKPSSSPFPDASEPRTGTGPAGEKTTEKPEHRWFSYAYRVRCKPEAQYSTGFLPEAAPDAARINLENDIANRRRERRRRHRSWPSPPALHDGCRIARPRLVLLLEDLRWPHRNFESV